MSASASEMPDECRDLSLQTIGAARCIEGCRLQVNTRHPAHCALHSTHYTPHSAHYIVHDTLYTLHTTHYTLHITHYPRHTDRFFFQDDCPGNLYWRDCPADACTIPPGELFGYEYGRFRDWESGSYSMEYTMTQAGKYIIHVYQHITVNLPPLNPEPWTLHGTMLTQK